MLGPQPESTSDQLLQAVQLFVSATGMSETRLLRQAGVDKHTLRQLRQGRSCTLATHDKIRAAMAAERARRAKAAPESGAGADTPTEKPGTNPADAEGNGAPAGCDASGESETPEETQP